MSDTVQACPDCDSSHIKPLTGHINRDDPDDGWKCYDCENRFDEPTRREAIRSTAPKSWHLAGRLDSMDPDEIGGSS